MDFSGYPLSYLYKQPIKPLKWAKISLNLGFAVDNHFYI